MTTITIKRKKEILYGLIYQEGQESEFCDFINKISKLHQILHFYYSYEYKEFTIVETPSEPKIIVSTDHALVFDNGKLFPMDGKEFSEHFETDWGPICSKG